VTAGAGEVAGVLSQPVDMHMLLDADFWDGILFEEAFDMQATMFQPVGGMDKIAYAFKRALGETVIYSAPVTELRKTAKGVRVGYTHAGQHKMIEVDYCVCALPLCMMKKMPNDLSAPFQQVIEQCTYSPTYKIAWESRRFWEQDYNIYGGLEFVKQGCSPVWLPSAGMFSDRGVLVSGMSGGFGRSLRRWICKGSLRHLARRWRSCIRVTGRSWRSRCISGGG